MAETFAYRSMVVELDETGCAGVRGQAARECGGGCDGEWPGIVAGRSGLFAGKPAPTGIALAIRF